MKANELKTLKTQKRLREESIHTLRRQVKDLNALISTDQAMVKKIDKDIEKITKPKTNKPPVVTEHAMLRYIERHYNISRKMIESAIVTDTFMGHYSQYQSSGKYPIAEGMIAVVKDNQIVTVEDKQ